MSALPRSNVKRLYADACVHAAHLAILLLFSSAMFVRAESSIPLTRPGGLAVVTGQEAARYARELAKTGQWLVRVRVDGDQVQAVRRQVGDLVPLVTVRAAEESFTVSEGTVNAVIMGKGSTLSPEQAGALVCPGGDLIHWEGGRWHPRSAPANDEHGDWTHWAADPQGTGIVSDTTVAPSSRLRWWDQSMIGDQLRTADGVVVVAQRTHGKKTRAGLMGLDVYSGVPLWNQKETGVNPKVGDTRLAFVATEAGVVALPPGDLVPAVLFDQHSGEELLRYEEGLRFVYPFTKKPYISDELDLERSEQLGPVTVKRLRSSHRVTFLATEDRLLQSYGRRIACLELETGKRLWQIETQNPVARMNLSVDGNRIYVQEGKTTRVSFARWGENPTSSITAFSVADGQELWRNTDENLMGKSASQLVEFEGRLFVYDQVTNIKQTAVHGDSIGDLYSLDPLNGVGQWHYAKTHDKDRGNVSMLNNAVAWQGAIWTYGKGGGLRRFAVDGSTPREQTRQPNVLGGNQRCVRTSGSTNYFVTGMTSWMDAEGNRYQTGLTRGNCSMPNYLARGALLTTTDQVCSCYNGIRGQVALVPQVPFSPVANSNRLFPPEARPVAEAGELPDTPLVRAWLPERMLRTYWEHEKLGPLPAGDRVLRVDQLRRVVSAYADAESHAPVWQQRVSGRIYAEPIVHGNTVFVPMADGFVTALDLTRGTVKWRFLAAPVEQELVVRGQLESRWPVHRLLIHENSLFVAAGRHSELDGGLWLWQLDPASGAVQHQARVHTPMTVLESGQTDRRSYRNIRNVVNRSIMLDGFGFTKEGKLALRNRWWWKSGSSSSWAGYWFANMTRSDWTGGRRAPNAKYSDRERPAVRWFQVDMEAWDGKTINPLEVVYAQGAWKK